MTYTHPFLDDWLKRLEVCNDLEEIDWRYSWSWRMRAKVLRYLILRYGHEPLEEPACGPVGSATATYLDLPSGDRRLPRTKLEIRRVLECIREAASTTFPPA